MVNALTIFAHNQLQDMRDLIAVNEELKTLEAKKKKLTDEVKKHMTSLNVSECELGNNSFSISDSVRRIVTKNTKDEFIAQLVGKGKQHLIITSVEPDVDGIFAEVDAGTLDKTFVDMYINIINVQTLRTK